MLKQNTSKIGRPPICKDQIIPTRVEITIPPYR